MDILEEKEIYRSAENVAHRKNVLTDAGFGKQIAVIDDTGQGVGGGHTHKVKNGIPRQKVNGIICSLQTSSEQITENQRHYYHIE